MNNFPPSDIWRLIDRDPASQNYQYEFKFDFSFFKSEEIKAVVKEYIWTNYITGSRVPKGLRETLWRFKYFNAFCRENALYSLRDFDNGLADDYRSFLSTHFSTTTGKLLSYSYQRACFSELKTLVGWCRVFLPGAVPEKQIFTGNEFRHTNARLKIEFIPDEILSTVNEALKAEDNPYLKYGIIILECTGMRLGDLLLLRVDCISRHPISGYTISWFNHKNRKSRSNMPIPQKCKEAVDSLLKLTQSVREQADGAEKARLFIYAPHIGTHKKPIVTVLKQTFTKWCGDFSKKHNIHDSGGNIYRIASHMFRRTLATDMLSKGTNIKVIQEVLGHASPVTTRKYYADVKDVDRAEMFSKIGVLGNIGQISHSEIPEQADLWWFQEKGYSRFRDDIWDLTPLIPQQSQPPSRKKLKFSNIKSSQLKFTVKQYMYYKLGQLKPQTAVGALNRLAYFIRFCEINDIHFLDRITTRTLLTFAMLLKTECGIGKRTSYLDSFAVEDMIRVGQIKGWRVPSEEVLTGATAREIWGSGKDESTDKKVSPIPDDVFNEIMRCAIDYKPYHSDDVSTKSGIIIQSQTGLRISEVLSIKSGCLHQPENGPAYFEVSLSKTVKGEPIIHRVFANELVVSAIQQLEQSTATLRKESGMCELFLTRNQGICVPNTMNWSKNRLRAFIRRCNIRGADGKLYPLKSHQFRATFVKQLIMKKIPIAYVMKQFAHVSIEMTCHYLTLQENEVKEIYSRLILSPDAKIAGICADEIKSQATSLFHGKTEREIDSVIAELSESLSFNPLPGGVCLYDYRRGNCSNGDGCFLYNCPNYITEISFLPILKKKLELMELEIERTKQLGYERQWQIQYSRYQHLQPLVAQLEAELN